MTWKLYGLIAALAPLAAVAQTIEPYGPFLRDGGVMAVLYAIARRFIKYMDARDAQTADFLRTQRSLADMAATRDQALERIGDQVADSFRNCEQAINANTRTLTDLKAHLCEARDARTRDAGDRAGSQPG